MIAAKFRKQSLLVGSRIRALRKDRDLTQADLASRIGIQQSDLCRMENGEYKVSLETLFRILSVFEMNIAEFFHEDLTGMVKERDSDILRHFHRLSPRSQEEVLDFIQFKLQFEDKISNSKKSN